MPKLETDPYAIAPLDSDGLFRALFVLRTPNGVELGFRREGESDTTKFLLTDAQAFDLVRSLLAN